ncbi:kinase-like domain-containing protein [Syncephalastrum racemosum]|uniref:Kinase-like domain-containing protein n=1 Tax=Syncephalastrum racemosum TaxID=13706 RepID=A0A1X2H529_SYNRA|nr:kinase-like domain-containing protein [Syncephalastrum racemosum]
MSRSNSCDSLTSSSAPYLSTVGSDSTAHQSTQSRSTIRETLSLESKDGSPSSQFQLGNCIGKGHFGSVYKALDLSTGEVVAVKRLLTGEDGQLDEEVMKEVSLLKTLAHVNVIHYLGFVRSKNHINIVLEYAENGSLMSTLKAFGAFPEKLVGSFCIKILNGLEYLHANSVVHCDLKAANILTTKTGDVKLTDFGVSLNLKLKESNDDGTISGTPNWMAPEVIQLQGTTPKSDIWSLGCTLIELATGKPPYASLIAMSAMFRIVEDEHPPLPEAISAEMHDFLLCCFQKDPEDRPSATQLKQHPWIVRHQKTSQSNVSSANNLVSNSTTLEADTLMHKAWSQDFSNGSISSYSSSSNESFCHSPDTVRAELRQQQQQQQQRRRSPRQSTSSIGGFPQPRVYYNIIPDDGESKDIDAMVDMEFGHQRYCSASSVDSRGSSHEQRQEGIHRFTCTSFGKAIACKVCGEAMSEMNICEVCSLVCHDACKDKAFLCPPKLNRQRPSYDSVFSAKIYNHQAKHKKAHPCIEPEYARVPAGGDFLDEHPQGESIRQYARSLGLTAHEVRALCENPVLLSHTLEMQRQQELQKSRQQSEAETMKRPGKRGGRKGSAVMAPLGAEEQCIIS